MRRRFAVKSFWAVTLATVLVMLITASLGRWQLGRASQKEARAQLMREQEQLPPLSWQELQYAAAVQEGQSVLQRRVNLEGQWIGDRTIFLDNRPLNGRAGYWVLSPFLPSDSNGPAVLVVRGWAPRLTDERSTVPALPAESGVVHLEGRLSAPPSKLYELGADASGLIRQNADIQSLTQEWSVGLLPVAVWQTGDAGLPEGWSRSWSVPNADVHKHYGYAVQWFGLSTLVLILYVWFQFIAPYRHARAASHEHA